jgi:hypothetical protein
MHINNVSKYFFSKEKLILVLGVVLFLGACLLNQKFEKPIIELSKQDSAININKDLLVFMSAGNKRLFTGLLWVQTLLESDLDHYGSKDLNNWLFLRFNTIAALDPNFYENYLYGGQFLNVVKDDLLGADIIYTKGVKVFPDDYQLNYFAGIMNYFEIGNNRKGYDYLVKIQDNPKAPVYIRSIVNKLALARGASLQDIYLLVKHHHDSTKDETLKRKLRSDLYAIKAEIDLKCLNHNLGGCEYRDLDGQYYVKGSEGYRTYKMFLPFRINMKGSDVSPRSRGEINTFK